MHVQRKSADKIFFTWSGTPTAEAPRHPQGHRGSVSGKSHFDFSMLVFSADFPPATKLRRKRKKTADAAAVIPHAENAKKKGGFPRHKVKPHHP